MEQEKIEYIVSPEQYKQILKARKIDTTHLPSYAEIAGVVFKEAYQSTENRKMRRHK